MWWSAWMSLDVFFSSQCCDSVNLHAMLLILFYVSAFLSTFSNFLSPFFQNIFVEINQINHCVRAINSVLFICLWCLCPVVAWYSYIPSFRQHEHTQVLFWHVHPVETGMHPYTNIPTIQKCSLKSTKVIQIHTHTHPPSERERGRERMNENEDKVKEIETRTYWNLIVAAPRGTAGDCVRLMIWQMWSQHAENLQLARVKPTNPSVYSLLPAVQGMQFPSLFLSQGHTHGVTIAGRVDNKALCSELVLFPVKAAAQRRVKQKSVNRCLSHTRCALVRNWHGQWVLKKM